MNHRIRALLAILLLAAPSFLPAASDAARQESFFRLYRMEGELQPLLDRLSGDLQAALALPPPQGGPFLFSATEATLAAFPAMPEGFRAVLAGAEAGAAGLAFPFKVQGVLAQAYMKLLDNPVAWSAEGPVLFPRLVRICNQRTLLSNFDFSEKLTVLRAGLADLAGRGSLQPSPLHGLALSTLDAAVDGAAAPLALLATLRGDSVLVTDTAEEGRKAFLRVGLGAAGENCPPALARAILVRFATVGAGSPDLTDLDRVRLQTALGVAAAIDDDAQAATVLKSAFGLLLQ